MEVFVGREREFSRLQLLRERGGVLLVAGEPGVGKSGLIRRFLADVERRGAIGVSATAYEGQWQPPYAAWIEILNQLSAAEVPHLGSEHGELSPEQERLRVFDTVTRAVLAAAATRPVVVVLDDLQWADADSLALLRYLGRFARSSRLALVGVYRHPGVETGSPLGAVLEQLQRESGAEVLLLSGLSADEVATYLAQSAGATVPGAVVKAFYDATTGNPFYTKHVWQLLVDSDRLRFREGWWSTDFSIAELGIPEGVRQVVAQRSARLSPATQRLLTNAAAFTGPFALADLQRLLPLDNAALLDALDEAIAAGLIRSADRAPKYHFAHAIIRHAVLAGMNPDREALLHRQVAESLESAGGTAAELAYQYHASASVPGAEGGVAWCRIAACEAKAVAAQAKAVRLLQMALDLVGADPRQRADLLAELAVAQAEAVLVDDALRTSALAFVALADSDSADLVAFATRLATALKDAGAPRSAWNQLVDRGLALQGEARDLAWARLTLLQDRGTPVIEGPLLLAGWHGLDPEAERIIAEYGDEDDAARALEPFDVRTPEQTESVLARARTWQRASARLRAFDVVARDRIYRQGDVRCGAEALAELLAEGERHGSVQAQAEALAQLALCQGLVGDLPRAQPTLDRARDFVRKLGPGHRLHVVTEIALPCVLGYLVGAADWPELAARTGALAADPALSAIPLGFTLGSFSVMAHGLSGNQERADRTLGYLLDGMERARPDTYLLNGAVWTATSGIWALHASPHVGRLRAVTEAMVAAGQCAGPSRSLELAAGRLAAMDGDDDAACAWFARAREVLESGGQGPLRAITDLDEAFVLERGGADARRRAAVLRNDAVAAFRRLSMTGWERQAGDPDSTLTDRETEVLALLAYGRTNREIARELVVAEPTVRRHVANIYRKLGTRNRAEATAYALNARLHTLVDATTDDAAVQRHHQL